MINKGRVLDKFLEYIQIDSPTKEERDFAKHLMKDMKELNIDVQMDDAGKDVGSNSGNVLGFLKGNTDAEPILLTAHMDTVSPGRGIKPQIKDGIIYSDGTTILGSDDKAGIAAILEAIKTIQENDIEHGDIELVFSIYEEGGLYGAKNLDYDSIKSKKVFVFDSGGNPGEIITSGPAQNNIDITFIGKESHAGIAPEDGISAIQMAASAIEKMNLLRIDEETTANIGMISGGEATNIVPNKVTLNAEARSLDNEKLKKQVDHMIECSEITAKEYNGEVEIEVESSYVAFKVPEDDDIVQKVKEACVNIGLEPITKPSGGGSDTNVYNANGITAINLGIGMKEAHTLNEHIAIKDLEKSAELALEIIKVNA